METTKTNEETSRSVFISGNLDLSDKKFIQYYMPIITELSENENVYFNISDDIGCSEMVQVLLKGVLKNKNNVNIYCIGDKPKIYLDDAFLCFSGFKTLEERNAAMTFATDMDLHIVLPGKGKSAVKDNLCRRNEPEYNYIKHYVTGKTEFWQMFFSAENLDKIDGTEEVESIEEVIN